MKNSKLVAICALLALLLVPAAIFAQEQAAPEHGVIEFGFRGVTGEVYGRTQANSILFSNGFRPDLLDSRLNLYSDYRNGFYIPKIDTRIDHLFGSKNYLRLQSASNGFAFQGGGSLTRDQSVLVSFGQYGHYKFQFRFDETPHIFSGTTRTIFSSDGAGNWTVPAALQAATFACLNGAPASSGTGTITGCPITGAAFVTSAANSMVRASTTLSNLVSGGLVAGVPGTQELTQQESRKTITGLMSWNFTPDVTATAFFSRENQVGTRPIGFVMGNGSGAYQVEAPESINYYTNTLKLTSEFGRKSWDASLGYQGSFFQNNTPSMVVANPFSTVYDTTSVGPATGRMDLYPDNRYQQFVAQGAADLGKYIHLMANVTPGKLTQNANFQPLTTNTFLTQTPPAGYPAFLPASSLNGKVDTLAMNYTAVLKATKDLKVVAKYQHYKWDDTTPELLLRPTVADTSYLISSSFHGSTAGCFDPVQNSNAIDASFTYYCPTEQSSFVSKLFDVGGTWFFNKKSSVKFGYQRGWMDRTHREVEESIEDSIYGALDLRLHKTVKLRVAGRHQNREPQEYEAESGDFYHRMPDQSTRVRNRGDASLSWDPLDRLNITGFFGTMQDNFNQRGGVNSDLPLGDASLSPMLAGAPLAGPTPIYGPYYSYGVLNGIGRNFGVDVSYALTPKVTLFAEYAREKNTGVFIQGRAFDPSGPCTRTSIPVTLRDNVVTAAGSSQNNVTPGVVYSGAGSAAKNCDPINDLFTANTDKVNNYYGGVDITMKKLEVSLFYNLSAGQSFLFSDGVNCQVGSNGPNPSCGKSFANWKLDYLTAATKVTGAASRATGGQAAAADLAAASAATATYYAFGVPGAGGFGFPQNVDRIHEVGAIVRFKLTDKLVPKFQYIYRQNDYKDWQTGVVNPYSFVGAPFSLAGTATDPNAATSLQKMLFLGADQPSYRAHVIAATIEYHF